MGEIEIKVTEARFACESWEAAERCDGDGRFLEMTEVDALNAANEAFEAVMDGIRGLGKRTTQTHVVAARFAHRGLLEVLCGCPREAAAAFERAANILRPNGQIDFEKFAGWLVI